MRRLKRIALPTPPERAFPHCKKTLYIRWDCTGEYYARDIEADRIDTGIGHNKELDNHRHPRWNTTGYGYGRCFPYSGLYQLEDRGRCHGGEGCGYINGNGSGQVVVRHH